MSHDNDRLQHALNALGERSSKDPLRIYLIAIGGTGMAPLACLLAELGHVVTGSDGPLYPPMSDLLSAAGIEPLVGYDADHLNPSEIDLVVVGNAVPRHNVEVVAAEELGLPRISMPEAVGHCLLAERTPIVATGTHGKTTTSAMAAWVLSECGKQPGYLIGGAPIGLESSFSLGSGEPFVIEGDEYNAAYFDRGPKFLHYRAKTVTLTSVEYDHVDLYPSAESFRDAFRQLIHGLPADGNLIACVDQEHLRRLAVEANCAVVGYSHQPAPNGDSRTEGFEQIVRPIEQPRFGPEGTHFRLQHEGQELYFDLKLWGEHNVANAIAVWCAATRNGCDPEQAARALSSFAGVKRRLQVLGEPAGVTVVDDFAHHPTEVAASLKALRGRYPERRLVALYEPRSLSAGRAAFADAYTTAFAPADVVLLSPVFHADRLGPEECLDLDGLCRRLQTQQIDAAALESDGAVVDAALALLRSGDVVVTMSSGSFGGAPHLLQQALQERMA